MPLVKATIKAEIKALTAQLNAGDPTNKTAEEVEDEYADGLADIIINAISSLTLTIPVGTIITAGSATTQTQSAPGIVTNGVS